MKTLLLKGRDGRAATIRRGTAAAPSALARTAAVSQTSRSAVVHAAADASRTAAVLLTLLFFLASVPAQAQQRNLREAENFTTLSLSPKDIDTVRYLKGYRTVNDGGQGLFTLTNTVASTNRGTRVQSPTANYSWDRLHNGEINVRWFGAYGDNSHDDATPLQDTINYAAVNGFTVLVPCGNYLLGSTLTLSNNVTIRGEGSCSILNSTNAVFSYGTATNITIRDIITAGALPETIFYTTDPQTNSYPAEFTLTTNTLPGRILRAAAKGAGTGFAVRLAGSGTNYLITLEGLDYQFPLTAGAAGDVLFNDGSAHLSWQSPTNIVGGSTNIIMDPNIFRTVGANVTMQDPAVLTNMILITPKLGVATATSLDITNSLRLRNVTGSRALVSDGSSFATNSTTTAAELGFVSGVTSAIQTQLNGKQASLGFTPVNLAGDSMTGPLKVTAFTNTALTASRVIGTAADKSQTTSFASAALLGSLTDETGSNLAVFNDTPSLVTPKLGAATATSLDATNSLRLRNVTANRALVSDSSSYTTNSVTTATELGFVSGVTSAIQTQLDAKQAALWASAGGILSPSPAVNQLSFVSQYPLTSNNVALLVDTSLAWTNMGSRLIAARRNTGETFAVDRFGGLTVGLGASNYVASGINLGLAAESGLSLKSVHDSTLEFYGALNGALFAGTDGSTSSGFLTSENQTTAQTKLFYMNGSETPSMTRSIAHAAMSDIWTWGATNYLTFNPWSAVSALAYTFNTGLAHTSGDLFTVQNRGTDEFTVAWDGKINGSVSRTELSYVAGVTSAIQTQLNGKQATLGFTPVNLAGDSMTGTLKVTGFTNTALTASRVIGTAADKSQTTSFASAALLASLTDETGTGLIVANDTPSLVTPKLGAATATSLDVTNSLRLRNVTASRALVSDALSLATNSVTTATELGFVSGVTSSIQAQLDAKQTLWASSGSIISPFPAVNQINFVSQYPLTSNNVALLIDTALAWTNIGSRLIAARRAGGETFSVDRFGGLSIGLGASNYVASGINLGLAAESGLSIKSVRNSTVEFYGALNGALFAGTDGSTSSGFLTTENEATAQTKLFYLNGSEAPSMTRTIAHAAMSDIWSWGATNYVQINPWAAVNTASFVFNSGLTHTSGDLFSLQNRGVPEFSVSFDGTINGAVSKAELGYVAGTTSSIQTQLNGKQSTLGFTPVNLAGDTMAGPLLVTAFTNAALTASRVVGTAADKSQTTSFASAALMGSLTDETGSNLAVFNDTPSLVTPKLGAATATSLDSTNSLRLRNVTASRALVSDSSSYATNSVTTAAELAFLSGVTSPIQSQISAKVDSVFGRFGTIVAASGDYTFNQISGTASLIQGGTGINLNSSTGILIVKAGVGNMQIISNPSVDSHLSYLASSGAYVWTPGL